MSKFLNNLDTKTKKMLKSFGIIIGIFVIFIIILSVMSGGGNVGYQKLENVIENAANNYFNNNKDKLPKDDGEVVKITSAELIAGNYMKNMNKYTSDSCIGEVLVTNNGGEYLYNTKLTCNNYSTKTISEVIEAMLVEEGDGLYLSNNEYYYRGKYVNNYIKLDNTLYRILGIDENDNLKLILANYKNMVKRWDSRYNVVENTNGIGVNDYNRSLMQENLQKYYNDLSNDEKKYIINYNWCSGHRSLADGRMSNIECNLLEKDYIGSIILPEYARISLDDNCTDVYSKSCKNYNYMFESYDNSFWTITGVSENTYEVFAISPGYVEYSQASATYEILPSFYISGSNVYFGGDGTNENPYIVK